MSWDRHPGPRQTQFWPRQALGEVLSPTPGGCSEKGGNGALGESGAFLEGKGACTEVGAVSSPTSPVQHHQGWGAASGRDASWRFRKPRSLPSRPRPVSGAPATLPHPYPQGWPLTFFPYVFLSEPSPTPPPKLFGSLSTFFQVFPGQFGVCCRARSGRFTAPSWVEWTRQ